MKRNTSLLTDQVRNKLMKQCVTAIITEAFVNALPFDKEEVAKESVNIGRYAVNVIGKMRPETLLDRAMESTKYDQTSHLYVQNLKEAVESVVDTATKRIVQESFSTENTIPEIVAQAKLNSDETEKFVNASKHSGTDAVAKLVKDKMIDVIKDERDAYEEEVKLREEVKDVIRQENDKLREGASTDEDATLESYLNLVLSPTDVRRHISVFSKMQDVCMEAIMHSNEEYSGEIPYKTMEKITLESTFPYFDLSNRSLMEELDTMLIVTESAIDADCAGEMLENKKKKIAKTAFICSICIMTLLETLKTMHLAKPEMSDVKNFVDDVTNIKNIVKTDLKNVEDKVGIVINDAKKSVALGAYNTLELSQAKESLEKVKGMLDKMIVTESEVGRKNRIISKINSALEAMTLKDQSSSGNTITGHFTERLREENMVNLEHGVKLLAQKPIVQKIQICLRSDLKCSENSNVDVEVRGNDASGACVCVNMIKIHALPEFGATVAEVIRNCANYCDFGQKSVEMYFTDSGYSVSVKG